MGGTPFPYIRGSFPYSAVLVPVPFPSGRSQKKKSTSSSSFSFFGGWTWGGGGIAVVVALAVGGGGRPCSLCSWWKWRCSAGLAALRTSWSRHLRKHANVPSMCAEEPERAGCFSAPCQFDGSKRRRSTSRQQQEKLPLLPNAATGLRHLRYPRAVSDTAVAQRPPSFPSSPSFGCGLSIFTSSRTKASCRRNLRPQHCRSRRRA